MHKQTTVLTREEMNEYYAGKPLGVALREKANAVIKECGCECHDPKVNLLHCAPCCQLCYEKLPE